MRQLQGRGIGQGIAVGRVLKMSPPMPTPEDIPLHSSPEEEKARVRAASEAVVEDLQRRAESSTDETVAEILKATALMAADPMLMDDVFARIDRGKTGERAVWEGMETFRATLEEMGGYMAERASDLGDISMRIRASLRGIPAPSVPTSPEPFILVAEDLAPADTATLDFSTVRALVTAGGGPTGHTAIIARSKRIPALVGVEGCMSIEDGQEVIVDAATGCVVVEPTAEDKEAANAEMKRRESQRISHTEARFADGEPVELLVNVGSAAEAQEAVAEGAEGVGLFRTEFLYLGAVEPPSLETQVGEYSALFSLFPKGKVVVRTLDAGADKPLPYLNPGEEPNPALGERGYRSLARHPEIARTQLEAIARAAEENSAEVWVMAPMVADAVETAQFVSDTRERGLPVAGVMAEVPSTVVLADQVFTACDFVSIGTNDLTQYLLAADRLLGQMGRYQDPWHPALLRSVALLGEAATKANKPLGVCGEAAADPVLAPLLIALGVTSLSVAPAALSEVRWGLAQTTREKALAAALEACAATSAEAARAAAVDVLGG